MRGSYAKHMTVCRLQRFEWGFTEPHNVPPNLPDCKLRHSTLMRGSYTKYMTVCRLQRFEGFTELQNVPRDLPELDEGLPLPHDSVQIPPPCRTESGEQIPETN